MELTASCNQPGCPATGIPSGEAMREHRIRYHTRDLWVSPAVLDAAASLGVTTPWTRDEWLSAMRTALAYGPPWTEDVVIQLARDQGPIGPGLLRALPALIPPVT